MAKVTGPLMSMAASGSIGGTLTFATWVGRAYVRNLVIPSNPQTLIQMAVRNAFSALGKANAWAGRTMLVGDGRFDTDAKLIQAIAPTDQRWNGYVVSVMTQSNSAAYNDAIAAWDALTVDAQDDWNATALDYSPSIQPAPQRGEGGVSLDPLPAGGVLFVFEYALYVLGIRDDVPGAVPPVYT